MPSRKDLEDRGQQVIDRWTRRFERIEWTLYRTIGSVNRRVRRAPAAAAHAASTAYHDSLYWLRMNVLPF